MASENVPEDLRKLGEKIHKLRDKHSAEREKKSSGFVSAARIGITVAADLLAGVLVGAGIGYVLDLLFGSKPLMLVIFLLFGGAAGFLNVYRTVKNEERK